MPIQNELITLGWREWISLPELGIKLIKAKVDTGAKTSCLHSFFVETYQDKGSSRVRFGVHPRRNNSQNVVICEADLIDRRIVSHSGGHRERRFVIETTVIIGNRSRRIEFTLTNRDSMRFRILLGRSALAGMYRVDPSTAYRTGKPRIEAPTPQGPENM